MLLHAQAEVNVRGDSFFSDKGFSSLFRVTRRSGSGWLRFFKLLSSIFSPVGEGDDTAELQRWGGVPQPTELLGAHAERGSCNSAYIIKVLRL